MSKAKKQRLKPVRTQPPAPRRPIDRLADWLAARSRPTRVLIGAGIALAFTIALAVVLYGLLFSANPDRLTFGPLNADNLPYLLLAFVIGAGFAFYWLGWRVLIGFDFEDTPLRPGRPAAIWVMIGLSVLVLTLVGGMLTALLASQS